LKEQLNRGTTTSLKQKSSAMRIALILLSALVVLAFVEQASAQEASNWDGQEAKLIENRPCNKRAGMGNVPNDWCSEHSDECRCMAAPGTNAGRSRPRPTMQDFEDLPTTTEREWAPPTPPFGRR